MALQQVPEIQDGRLVGHTVQLHPGKTTHRLDLVKRLFHRRIAQVVEELQAVNPQESWPRGRAGPRHCPSRSSEQSSSPADSRESSLPSDPETPRAESS